jgi:hypothetical protein
LRLIAIFDALELRLSTGEGMACLNKVGLGFWNQPVRERSRHIHVFLLKTVSSASEASRRTYTIDEIEYQPHCNAKLFKVEIAVIVNVGEIPHSLELVVSELTVLEHGSCLAAGKVSASSGQSREYFPVLFDLGLLYAFVRHDVWRERD